MIRVVCERPNDVPLDDIKKGARDWVNNHNEVLETQSMSIQEQPINIDNPQSKTHLRGNWRFSLDSTKQNLIDQIENKLQKWVSWYIVGYHGCDHDISDRNGCVWNRKEEFGKVPNGVSL